MISIFIKNNRCDIYTYKNQYTYYVSDLRKMADQVPMFLFQNLNIKHVIYSYGPLSFTTARIVHSIIKGIKIAYSNVKVTGVYNFLTYANLLKIKDGTFSIPTGRGDYFISKISNFKLSPIEIQTGDNIQNTITEETILHKTVNMAEQQFCTIFSSLAQRNPDFVVHNTNISYIINPQFKKLSQYA